MESRARDRRNFLAGSSTGPVMPSDGNQFAELRNGPLEFPVDPLVQRVGGAGATVAGPHQPYLQVGLLDGHDLDVSPVHLQRGPDPGNHFSDAGFERFGHWVFLQVSMVGSARFDSSVSSRPPRARVFSTTAR